MADSTTTDNTELAKAEKKKKDEAAANLEIVVVKLKDPGGTYMDPDQNFTIANRQLARCRKTARITKDLRIGVLDIATKAETDQYVNFLEDLEARQAAGRAARATATKDPQTVIRKQEAELAQRDRNKVDGNAAVIVDPEEDEDGPASKSDSKAPPKPSKRG